MNDAVGFHPSGVDFALRSEDSNIACVPRFCKFPVWRSPLSAGIRHWRARGASAPQKCGVSSSLSLTVGGGRFSCLIHYPCRSAEIYHRFRGKDKKNVFPGITRKGEKRIRGRKQREYIGARSVRHALRRLRRRRKNAEMPEKKQFPRCKTTLRGLHYAIVINAGASDAAHTAQAETRFPGRRKK